MATSRRRSASISFLAKDPITSLIAAFGVFAAGFLMRPVGGLVFGHIGDRIGRKLLLIVSALGTLILAWPLFWMMHHPYFAVILLGQMGFAVLIGLFLSVCPATMVEVFPARVRCSALSVGYNLCLGVLGGTTPMVVTYLVARSHDDLLSAFYLMAAATFPLQ